MYKSQVQLSLASWRFDYPPPALTFLVCLRRTVHNWHRGMKKCRTTASSVFDFGRNELTATSPASFCFALSYSDVLVAGIGGVVTCKSTMN